MLKRGHLVRELRAWELSCGRRSSGLATNCPHSLTSDNHRQMRIRLRALFTLLFAAQCPLQALANVCVYKPPMVGHIYGRITDGSDQPIPQAQVSVMRAEETVQTIVTGETGEFNFDSLRDGKYEIDVKASGFQHARYMLKLSSHRNPKPVLRITLGIGSIRCQGSIEVEKKPTPLQIAITPE